MAALVGVTTSALSAGRRNRLGAGEMVSAPILNAEGIPVRELHVPMVQLVCTRCRLVLTYAAVPIGLV